MPLKVCQAENIIYEINLFDCWFTLVIWR